ncbi:hypothetical protein LPJ66_005041 [Kickxella alabastrina]|uniref:Uncharacterized protein n=1 Tax=Kickxella alabastrina TaxID=61397 RepID=A0ACC1IFU7_9FUNG|nr:hypothetical protein LPJ66_005041 [Kickxella alabastrina]
MSPQALVQTFSQQPSEKQQLKLLQQAKSLQSHLSSCPHDPFMAPTTHTGYSKRAIFSATSRLLTCLVNEDIVNAYYVEYNHAMEISYIVFVPCGSETLELFGRSIVSQVRHRPILSGTPINASISACQVRMLDPEDLGLGQWIWRSESISFEQVADPSHIMLEVAKWNRYDGSKVQAICDELTSSVSNQLYAYEHRKLDPAILTSTAIEWEQSIVEGHATHPMHRARYSLPPLKPIVPETEMFHINLEFVAVPRSELRIEGFLEELLNPLYSAADFTSTTPSNEGNSNDNITTVSSTSTSTPNSQYILDFVDRSNEAVLPVHPLHMPAVLEMFKFARKLPFSVPAEAQASLRTVCPQAFVSLGYDIKLPLGIKVSSALRTISPWSTFVGPQITKVIPEILRGAPVQDALLIAGEPASAVSTNQNFDIAKYLSCIIRNDPEHICRPRGERVILAAALTGYSDDGTSMVVRQWGLDNADRRRRFLQSYTDRLFDAFLPPIMNHGFAFESHPQNSLLRIDAETGEIKGFIVRDFGGVKVHLETFTHSTGATIDMLPDSCTNAAIMYEVYDLAYHTLVQCQLHRLVRALDLHYCGSGWKIVRESFERHVPESHPLRSTWYQETFDLKCFVTMKLDGLYRDYIYKKVPNVMFYCGESEGIVFPPELSF